MRITVTGATGRIGQRIVAALRARGDEVTVLSRDPERAAATLGHGVGTAGWDPKAGPPPTDALEGRAAVIHLAGEDVGQRWSAATKREIHDSREQGTRNLVAGLRAAADRPGTLVSASAQGFYGPRGDEEVDEDEPPGDDFLARVVTAWEHEADAAAELGTRVVRLRTGIVLDRHGGALERMLLPFRLGLGGPVAGGRQYMPWVHRDDVTGLYLAAVDDERWSGPVNASAPRPVPNREFSKALGRALRRPAVLPVPGFALKALYGEMSMIVTGGVNMVPRRALALGHPFEHEDLDAALADVLAD
jgi:uncharacterized protein